MGCKHPFFFKIFSPCIVYCKVASRSLLVAEPMLFKVFMKRKIDAYVFWPLAKRFQNWIVARSTQSHFREVVRRAIYLEKKSGFWQSAPALNLGSTESSCIVLPNDSILCLDSQIMIFQYSVLAVSQWKIYALCQLC